MLITEFDSLPEYMGRMLSSVIGGTEVDWKTIQLYASEGMVSATQTYRASQGSYSPPPNH